MKVPGVRQVVVEQTWEPGWSSNQLTREQKVQVVMAGEDKGRI